LSRRDVERFLDLIAWAETSINLEERGFWRMIRLGKWNRVSGETLQWKNLKRVEQDLEPWVLILID
jgi:hypothetical protein